MLCWGRRDNLVVGGYCVELRDHRLDVVDSVGSVDSNRDTISRPCLFVMLLSRDRGLPCLDIFCD
jgi:hypothetical protein